MLSTYMPGLPEDILCARELLVTDWTVAERLPKMKAS